MNQPPVSVRSTLKPILTRGCLVAAANWQVTLVQATADSLFKLLLAVPLLTCAKIVAERMEDGHVLAMLLSRSSKQDVAPATTAEREAN